MALGHVCHCPHNSIDVLAMTYDSNRSTLICLNPSPAHPSNKMIPSNYTKKIFRKRFCSSIKQALGWNQSRLTSERPRRIVIFLFFFQLEINICTFPTWSVFLLWSPLEPILLQQEAREIKLTDSLL